MSGTRSIVPCFLILPLLGSTLSAAAIHAQAEVAPGTITEWELSRAIKAERVNRDAYPGFMTIFGAGWQKVQTEPSGLFDISRYAERSEGGPDLVFARTVVRSTDTQAVQFSFGYRDEADLFLNGR